MATLKAGGRIPGLVSITAQADNVTLAEGDPVHITTTYKVVKSDGTKPVIGTIKAITKKWPAALGERVADPLGDVSVQARGWCVDTLKSGNAVAAGIEVGIGVAGKVVATGAGVSKIGVSLSSTTAVDQDIDVLYN